MELVKEVSNRKLQYVWHVTRQINKSSDNSPSGKDRGKVETGITMHEIIGNSRDRDNLWNQHITVALATTETASTYTTATFPLCILVITSNFN